MTRDEIKACVIRNLMRIAPDISPGELDPATNLRDQTDFDSMDFLNFVIAVYKELHIDIPETDYPQMLSLNGCVDYLCKRLAVE
jgi:acyl carrier protein